MKKMVSKTKRCAVLIVEDDQLALELMRDAVRLKFPEVDVYAAGNGKVGLQLYTDLQPQVVVTDAVMPEMDGVEMIRNIRSRKTGTKVIMVTGFTDFAGRGETEHLLDHLIFKPLDFGKMFEALDACIIETCGRSSTSVQ